VNLLRECKKRNIDFNGTIVDLKQRLKTDAVKQNSIEDLFKKYEQDTIKE